MTAATTTTTALFDVDTLALLLTIFVIYSNTIKRRKWWMDVSLKPPSLLVYHKDQRSSSSSTRLARLGEVSDTITGATPGRGVEQLPYFFSLEVIMFTPMALGVSLGVVILTRYFTGRRNPYSPFFLGAVLCMAFPVLLSAWRAARSSNGNQVASLLAALIITPIACFNTSALFGVDPPQPNFPLSPEQQALLNELGMEKLVPILRGIAHTMLYVGLLLAVYTIGGRTSLGTELLDAWIRGSGQTARSRETCNSICRDAPQEAAAESVDKAPLATRERLVLYFAFLSPMAIPLFISPLTSPLPSAVPSEFITCCLAIFIIDFRVYMMFPGVVQHWLLSRADSAAAGGGGLELETRYMRALYTAFECAVVPRFITVFIELDMALRIIPAVLGLVEVDNTVGDLSSILPILPDDHSANEIDYSQLIPRIRRAISAVWSMVLPPAEVMKWSKIYVGTLILVWVVIICGTLVYRSSQVQQTKRNNKTIKQS